MSNIEKVLLKRDWRTGLGRFRRSADGIPTEIPKKVLRRYKLPKDAQVVGADYVLPDHRDDEAESIEATAAQQEAEINRRVNEELDRRKKEWEEEQRKKAGGGEAEFDANVLDGSIEEISKKIAGKSAEELQFLLEKEQGGKTRKGVVVLLEAALEDLEEG